MWDTGTDSDVHLLFFTRCLSLLLVFFLLILIEFIFTCLIYLLSYAFAMVWAFAIQGQKLSFAVGLPTPTKSVKSKENIVQHYLYMSLTRCLTEPTPVVSCSRFAPVAIRAAFTMHGPNGWFSRGSFGTLHSFYRTPSYFHCSLLLV